MSQQEPDLKPPTEEELEIDEYEEGSDTEEQPDDESSKTPEEDDEE